MSEPKYDWQVGDVEFFYTNLSLSVVTRVHQGQYSKEYYIRFDDGSNGAFPPYHSGTPAPKDTYE